MKSHKIVLGSGPVGWTVAQQLAQQGHPVRVLTRSDSGPEHPLIERLSIDASNTDQLRTAFSGADAVFHCIHSSTYSADAWRSSLPRAESAVLTAAGEAGAVVIFPESLYSYDTPEWLMTEHSSRQARGGKRGIRRDLLAARAASATPTISVVASDFFGPQVLTAHAGERAVPTLLQGKRLWVMGSARTPHSFTYIADLAAAMVRASTIAEARNQVLHAPTLPALTQQELAQAFATAAGLTSPKISAIPGWVVRAAAVVSPEMKEMAELLYQFEQPFIMDSAESERLLDLAPTPLTIAARDTVEWWQQRA